MNYLNNIAKKLKTFFRTHFWGPSAMTFRQRVVLIVLAVLLFFSLAFFGPVLASHRTVLNSNYVASYVDRVNLSTPAYEWLDENVAPDKPVLAKALKIGATAAEPWLKEQLKRATRYMHGFILERIKDAELLNTIASQRQLATDVARDIESLLNLPILEPVFEWLGTNPAAMQKYVSASSVDSFFDAAEKLARIRTITITAIYSYIPLIFFILILIALIVFINRQVIGITRRLGIVFTAYGVLQFAFVFPLINWGVSATVERNMPQILQDFLQRLVIDYMTVLEVFSLVIGICGIAMLVFSFIYKPLSSRGTKAIDSSAAVVDS